MLGFFVNPAHVLKVLAFALGLAVIALVVGIATGAFEHNNREPLRLEREAAAAHVQPSGT